MTKSFVEAEFDYIVDDSAVCWITVANGLRVKTSISLATVKDLNLRHGDLFMWDDINQVVQHKPSRDVEYNELRKEYDKLSREFEENLKNKDLP